MDAISTWFVAVIIFALLIITGIASYDTGYRKGQIDVMTGNVRYCLEKSNTYELTWQYHEKGCEK